MPKNICLLFFVVLIKFINYSDGNINISESYVNITNGVLRGFFNGDYHSFLGVPYAEPPIGVNRFEPTKRYNQIWNEIRNATEYSSVCMQWNQFPKKNQVPLMGKEDCLYLNIFTPTINTTTKLPVFLYIHGGAFMYSSGDFFGPKYLLNNPIVFISLNYRLGPLGFLSTEDDIVSGNMGLKDQTMALKWIQENIKEFGGDPNHVIITGFSAGGASVHLHYMSNLSKGLFSKGISHSGCAINPWVLIEKSLQRAQIIAKNIDCPIDNTSIMISCLKGKSAEDIVKSVSLLQAWMYNPFSPFGVVVESTNINPFLSEHPIEYLKNGLITDAPWLTIAASSEGLYPAASFFKDGGKFEELDEHWNEYAPHIMHYQDTINSDIIDNISTRIRTHYLNDSKLSEKIFFNLQQMIGDRLFIVDIGKSLRFQSNLDKENVYFCYNKFSAQRSIAHTLAGLDDYDFEGACHGDDLAIFMNNVMLTNYTNEEIEMSKKFVNLYYTFATTSNPKFGETELKKVESSTGKVQFLNIVNNNNITIQTTNDLGQNNFWCTLPFDENENL